MQGNSRNNSMLDVGAGYLVWAGCLMRKPALTPGYLSQMGLVHVDRVDFWAVRGVRDLCPPYFLTRSR